MSKKSYLQVPAWDSNDRRLGGSCCSNDSSQWQLDENSNDKYTAAIELSNKCREFYKSRLEAANKMKSKWRENSLKQHDDSGDSDSSFSSSSSSLSSEGDDNGKTNRSKQPRHRIDQAMEKLRTEMVSLMDQDLSLMKQLLTLNETIEELKWQQQYYSYSTSWASVTASKNLQSNLSLSDTEMYDSECDLKTAQKASNSSTYTNQLPGSTWHDQRICRQNSTDFQISEDCVSRKVENVISAFKNKSMVAVKDHPSTNTEAPVPVTTSSSRYPTYCHAICTEPITIHHERGENSFDSGIHEAISGDEHTWSS